MSLISYKIFTKNWSMATRLQYNGIPDNKTGESNKLNAILIFNSGTTNILVNNELVEPGGFIENSGNVGEIDTTEYKINPATAGEAINFTVRCKFYSI